MGPGTGPDPGPCTGVAVVGSANLDIVVHLRSFPQAGETVLGDRLEEAAGGKGLNQSIAAARTGRCAFVGCMGEDEAAALLLRRLAEAGVDTRYITRLPVPSGRAFIQVAAHGENSIVVMALANSRLGADAVRAALDQLRPAVVLCQLEIPLDAVEAAAEWAGAAGARFLLNPSPVRDLPASVLGLCDPLVVNAGEAAALLEDDAGSSAAGIDDGDRGRRLVERLGHRVRSLVLTDGPRGLVLQTADGSIVRIPGHRVDAVDTTGAGDEFAGALAAALARGSGLQAAAEEANRAAAHIVTVPRRAR